MEGGIKMNTTDKQVGGAHYQTPIQPVQYIHANNLNFFEGNVVKYITRHRNKGGKADLEKAIHYIEMLIEFEYNEDISDETITYNTKKQDDCINCIFHDEENQRCFVSGTELTRYCIAKNIIYTSLKK